MKASDVHAFRGSWLASNYQLPLPIGPRVSIESPPLPLSISCARVESGSLGCCSTRRRAQTRRAAARRLRTDENRVTSTFPLLSDRELTHQKCPKTGGRASRETATTVSPWVRVSPGTRRLPADCRQGNDLNTQPEMVCRPQGTSRDTTTTTTAANLNVFPQ